MQTEVNIIEQLKLAKESSKKLAISPHDERNRALKFIAEELIKSKDLIIFENKKDIEEGKKNGLSSALLDRLLLNEKRLESMSSGIKKVIAQNDPIGKVLSKWKHKNGMDIEKISVPLGVICVIYEARPNVTTDAVALALKSGNAIILRGSQHAIFSNQAIVSVINNALKKSLIELNTVQFISSKDREETVRILQEDKLIDLVIPRGGEDLKNFVQKHSKIPVIGAGGGTCHLFIDETADENMAIEIAINAKTQRPGVCNAIETILVHNKIANKFLPKLEIALRENDVQIYGCENTKKILSSVELAAKEDWYKEYLDLRVSIKIVDSIDEAINHINKYGTKHSEAIITCDVNSMKKFQNEVDAACVYVNASTRFTDGEEFGFGAEVGISTQKLHARGPIGLEQLTTYKYLISGNGQIRG